MNDDTQYEKFTQEVYRTLIEAQDIKTINVQHNIKLMGKSKQCYQIDVYWEYEIAGVKNKVAIECKNYNKKVPIGNVRDFGFVLSDLNNVHGIMVTKIGYQSGAKNIAEHYGIHLKELRIPNNEDWKGRLKKITFKPIIVIPQIKQRIPIPDNEWVKNNIELPEKDNSINYSLSGMANEIIVFDENNNPITNFYELDNKVPTDSENKKDVEHLYEFENGYLLVSPLGKIKIKGIKYIYDINIIEENEFSIDAEETVKAIIKDALSGDIKFINNNGSVK